MISFIINTGAKWRHELAALDTPDDGPVGGPKHVR
jgi:hypothetical protein